MCERLESRWLHWVTVHCHFEVSFVCLNRSFMIFFQRVDCKYRNRNRNLSQNWQTTVFCTVLCILCQFCFHFHYPILFICLFPDFSDHFFSWLFQRVFFPRILLKSFSECSSNLSLMRRSLLRIAGFPGGTVRVIDLGLWQRMYVHPGMKMHFLVSLSPVTQRIWTRSSTGSNLCNFNILIGLSGVF